jgi:hypothetical protein
MKGLIIREPWIDMYPHYCRPCCNANVYVGRTTWKHQPMRRLLWWDNYLFCAANIAFIWRTDRKRANARRPQTSVDYGDSRPSKVADQHHQPVSRTRSSCARPVASIVDRTVGAEFDVTDIDQFEHVDPWPDKSVRR